MLSFNEHHCTERHNYDGKYRAKQHNEPGLRQEIIHMVVIYRISANESEKNHKQNVNN